MNPFDISGKIVLVTGGTRGLGRAISLHLASQGAVVLAGYFQNEEAAEAFRRETQERGFNCPAIKANLMTSGGIQTLFDAVISTHGRLDALIYNSATGVHKGLDVLTQRHLSIVWQVNVGAFFDLSQKFRPYMPSGSRIVALSSEGAWRAVEQYGAIGSSKAALEALCRQMAAEWSVNGIAVNVVSPGLLQTDTLSAMTDGNLKVAHEMKVSPLRRLITLEEVAHVVHFLCSKASDGIIGQTLVIDGGKRMSSVVNLSQ
jgi:enoyl-[acyl-carrier protein] reductase III